MTSVALAMLLHAPGRSAGAVLGVTGAFFLTAAQIGLLVGWCNTTSAIVRHTDADVWVMSRKTSSFDYGTAIPRSRLYQVRSVPGVEWAEAMFMAWNTWQRPDGQTVNVELIGLDESLVGGPWKMRHGTVDAVYLPESVIVDELFLPVLGIEGVGAEVEMYARRAIVRGVSEEVRTFTASPFIFTSINSAIAYDRRYRPDEITYVLARCGPGLSPEVVRDRIRAAVPAVDVLTSREFAIRTVKYWMLGTGVGITVVLTAALGLGVGSIIISQTLYALTNDHLRDYGAMLAVGFGRANLAGVVIVQSLILGALGICLGSVLFYYAMQASARTPIPLETNLPVFGSLVAMSLAACVLASLLAVRSIFRIDPVAVFHN